VGGLGAVALAAGSSKVPVTEGKPGEFSLVPKGTPSAGKVTVAVASSGKIVHEMVVTRTSLPAGKLSTNAKGLGSESGAVGETGDVRPGTTRTITLEPQEGQVRADPQPAGSRQGRHVRRPHREVAVARRPRAVGSYRPTVSRVPATSAVRSPTTTFASPKIISVLGS
jgi:hypothetical protein